MTPGTMTEEEFADRLRGSWRALWCIAAAVLGRNEDVEDVVQEAALVGLRKRHEFDPNTSFVAWMGQISRYIALNAARNRQRRAALGKVTGNGSLDHVAEPHRRHADRTGSHDVDAQGRLTGDQRAFDDRVQAALAQLDETARACLLLRTMQELPYREISLALDIPEGTAMSHVHRARARMRALLDEPAMENSRTSMNQPEP